MPKNYTHNAAFRRIAGALRLDSKQIVAICKYGDLAISRSQADGWKRGAGTHRKPDHGSRNPAELERRDKPISDEQWEAFWYGLDEWLHETSGWKGES